MPRFRIWDEECMDGASYALAFESPSAKQAALDFAEETHENSFYPAERRLIVQAEGGERTVFDVFAEHMVSFEAHEVPAKRTVDGTDADQEEGTAP